MTPVSIMDKWPMHPEFTRLYPSWELEDLRYNKMAANTIRSYTRGLMTFARWLYDLDPLLGPVDVTRSHIKQWVVHVTEATPQGATAARSWFCGVRRFFRWMAEEGERSDDPTEGLKTPKPAPTTTPVLSTSDVKALLESCRGNSFVAIRDLALLHVFADCGLRLSEVAGLMVEDVDVAGRYLIVYGKGAKGSGRRRRLARMGTNTARSMSRYLRMRDRHPHADKKVTEPDREGLYRPLWLGDRNRGPLADRSIEAVLQRRAAALGVHVHPHMFRHTWADQYRRSGGNDSDLMVLGGWSTTAMLARYGRAAAQDRALEAASRHSLADRL
jgi:integrase/recombinase XerC